MTHDARPARKRTTFQERKPRWIIIRDTLIMLFERSPATPLPRVVAWFPIPAHRQVRGIADQLHFALFHQKKRRKKDATDALCVVLFVALLGIHCCCWEFLVRVLSPPLLSRFSTSVS
jgi:hypothetical protein